MQNICEQNPLILVRSVPAVFSVEALLKHEGLGEPQTTFCKLMPIKQFGPWQRCADIYILILCTCFRLHLHLKAKKISNNPKPCDKQMPKSHNSRSLLFILCNKKQKLWLIYSALKHWENPGTCGISLGQDQNPIIQLKSSFQTKLIFFQTVFIAQLLCASTSLNVLRTKTTLFFIGRGFCPLKLEIPILT